MYHLRPNVRDFPAGYTGIRPPAVEPAGDFPLRIASWLIFPTVRGRILDFVELCNILYTAGPANFEFALWKAVVGLLIHRVCLLTAACWQTAIVGFLIHRVCLLTAACFPTFTQGGARNISRISLNSEMKYFHNRANYFHPGANTDRLHGSRNS